MNKYTSEMCIWFVLARYMNRKQTRSQNFNDRIPAFVSAFFFRSDHVSIKQLLRVTKRLRAYYTTYLNLREYSEEKSSSGMQVTQVFLFLLCMNRFAVSIENCFDWIRHWHIRQGKVTREKKKSRPTFSWSSIMLYLLRTTTKRII